MKKILAIVMFTFLIAACGSPRTHKYPTVKVEVVFLVGSRDTLIISEKYSMNSATSLFEYKTQYSDPDIIATQVKYVKRLEK